MIIESMKKMKKCRCKALKVPEMQRMCNAVRMSRELEERELIEKAKQGDKSALLALYEQYLPFFKKLCRNRADYSNVLDCDDLLQECFLALKLALKSYTFEHGTAFVTYLYTCTKRHLQKVMTSFSPLSRFQVSMILKIKQFREDYEKWYGKLPEDGLIMHEFCISSDCLRELDTLRDLKAVSLDGPVGENGDCTLADLLPSETDLEERTVKRLSIVQLWEFLGSCLLPEELKIIELLYLERQTFKSVAEMTGKTEAEIQTIQTRSLKKLRKKEKLKDYLQ